MMNPQTMGGMNVSVMNTRKGRRFRNWMSPVRAIVSQRVAWDEKLPR